MTVEGVIAVIGGVVLLLPVIAFVRSMWRDPPEEPGNPSDFELPPDGS